MKLAPSPIQQNPAGLLAQLESTRIPLPLKALEVEAQITGDLVSVELDQLFLQDHPEPLNCTYTFPLPANAAVYRCEMHVGDRVIEAKTMKRDDARRIFEEKKEAGRRAALAEMDRENLFNLELGNLQPGDLIRVCFAYVQQLETLDDLRSLRIPLTPSVRYVPGRVLSRANRSTGTVDDTDQVPDASRLSPPRIDSLHPDAATFHLRLQIVAPRAQLTSLQSSSHAIKVSEGEEQTILTLRDSEEVPNRDFVVEWTTKPASMTTARAWVTSHRSHRYALLELNGGPMASEKKEKENRDVYVLLDRSGSMSGEPWRAACRAVHSFARSLPTGTRIDLTLFESSFTHFTGEPRPAGELLKQLGEHASSLIALGVAGGTDLLPAFNAAISRRNRFSGDRPASLLILTDGMVANEQAIIDSARASGTNVHLMGIGLAPNDAMRSAAEATGGQAVFASPHDDLDKMITRFSSRLAKPLLENIDLPEGWAPANENSLIAVFPQEQRRVLLRGDEASEMGAVRAHQDGAPIDLEIETRRVENSALPLLWARERIRHLESRGQVEEALELSLGFNLPTSQTSFVAWDREEQVTVADRHLHQPAHEIEASLLGVGVNTAQSASRSFFEGKKTLYSFIEIECGDEFYDHLSSASRRPPQTPDETVPETKAEEAERAQPSLETPPSKDHLERSVVGETVQPPSPAKAEEKTNLQTPQGDPKSAPGMIARILGIFRTLIRWLTRFLRRNSR